nr:SMR family transporter [Chitinophaga eiseniae]
MKYLLLLIAIIAEVIATSALKASEGFPAHGLLSLWLPDKIFRSLSILFKQTRAYCC